MSKSRHAVLLLGITGASCQSYAPAPVDLSEHARQFAARLPDDAALSAFVDALRASSAHAPPAAAVFGTVEDGVQREEARWIALHLNPDLAIARLEAGVAAASAENAGLLDDPSLNGSVGRVLESTSTPWLLAASIGFTLPLSGRLGLEEDLADERFVLARTEARLAEARTLDEVDRAWVRWSAGRLRSAILGDLLLALRDLESIAQRLADVGALTRIEARVFSMERLSRVAESIRVKAEVATSELELKRWLGLPPASALSFDPSLVVPDLVADAEARRERLRGGRAIVRAERAHLVAERDLELEVAEQWPDLTLYPGWQDEDGQSRGVLGFSLPLPLWNANARAIAEARARRLVAEQVLRSALERSLQDLALSEVRVEAAREQRRLVESELIPSAEEQLARGRALTDLGQLDVLLILDAVLRVYEAKSVALDAVVLEGLATIERNALYWPEVLAPITREERR
ncbi:MAG: TolC family protein [Candidatus Eisenbacteria bacterium]|nr:TolC family protein [Candidatus Eisenbacteria bacterium]